MISGLQAVSIYEPVTKTVVQLNNLEPSGKYKADAAIVTDVNGNKIKTYGKYEFECTSYDYDKLATLKSWMDNKTSIRMVAAGVEEIILWEVDSKLLIIDGSKFKVGDINGFTLSLAIEGKALSISKLKNIGSLLGVSPGTITKIFPISGIKMTSHYLGEVKIKDKDGTVLTDQIVDGDVKTPASSYSVAVTNPTAGNVVFFGLPTNNFYHILY